MKYKYTDLVCLECGNVVTINRSLGRQKSVGHIKDMFCPYCNKNVKFFEVKDISIFKIECYNKKYLSEDELFVINLLNEREKNNEKRTFGVHKKILVKR